MGAAVKIELEPFSRWMREAIERGLFEAHWNEVGEDHEKIPLDPDFQKLLMLERAGVLAAFSARGDDGVLAGYAMVMVSPHPIYSKHVFAFCQEFYIAREHRGHGVPFVRVIEREMRGRGVAKLYFTYKEGTPAGELFHAIGYRASERSCSKLL